MKKIVFIGPIANVGGPAIKNKILIKHLAERAEINVWNTYNKSLKSRIGAILKILFTNNKYIIVSVSRKGRNILYPLLLLKKKVASIHFSCIIIGGKAVESFRGKYSKHALGFADLVTVETKGLKEQMERVFNLENVYWLPNYKEIPEKKKVVYQPDKYSQEELKFIFLSSMRNLKGVKTLIKAFISTKKLGYNISLDFYGPIKKDFDKELLKQINDIDGMQYCGEVKNEAVLSVMQNYHVFVFPTEHPNEGFPAVLVEAQAAGLPIIASDINYNSEIVHDEENGYIFEHGNADQLKEIMIKCCINRDDLRFISKKNLKTAIQYDADAVITAYAEKLRLKGWPI